MMAVEMGKIGSSPQHIDALPWRAEIDGHWRLIMTMLVVRQQIGSIDIKDNATDHPLNCVQDVHIVRMSLQKHASYGPVFIHS